jgi:hypothetical protein
MVYRKKMDSETRFLYFLVIAKTVSEITIIIGMIVGLVAVSYMLFF